ncbi:MAG: Holliday junction resolvase RuvX [Planctomycetes bacterium]|nr:Holliday junction resolvase RuvX [Planctomycetota bacterium]
MKGPVLAIDHGTKRTGFASVDALRIVSKAIETYQGPGDDAKLLEHVAALVDERDVRLLLVGLPVNVDGTEGPRAAEVREFAARLSTRLPRVPLKLWNETLTTKAAEELLREAGHHGKEARARRDSWSALVLLRDWMESGEPG